MQRDKRCQKSKRTGRVTKRQRDWHRGMSERDSKLETNRVRPVKILTDGESDNDRGKGDKTVTERHRNTDVDQEKRGRDRWKQTVLRRDGGRTR